MIALQVALYLRESLQFLVSPQRYLTNLENHLELAMLGFNSYVLANWEDPASMKQFSALVLLLAWMDLWLLIGGLPTMSIFMAMYTTGGLSNTF